MATVSLKDVKDFTPEGILDVGVYLMEIQPGIEILSKDNGTHSLRVPVCLMDGPDQNDGSSPEGRNFSLFFTLDGYENHKDGGKYAKTLLTEFYKVAGVDMTEDEFDPETLVGARFQTRCRHGKDQSGDPQEQFDKLREA